MRLHLHLLSDSTGETLDVIAKAALAQFEGVRVVRHVWPLLRTPAHLDRIADEIRAHPGVVLYTVVDPAVRGAVEALCRTAGLPALAALDAVTQVLSEQLGQKAHGVPGRQHAMDAAYFERVDAIQFAIAHDDGAGWDNWEAADIVLAGVSRTSKTPTSIYLANRGYRTANIPIVPAAPPPPKLFALARPLVVGLTTSADRLMAVRRSRLSALAEPADAGHVAAYVDEEAVRAELAFARRLFTANGWPVIDVTRRSIEETAAAVIRLCDNRRGVAA